MGSSRDPKHRSTVIQLRGGADQGTALESADADVLASDLSNARIEGCKHGLLLVSVQAQDDPFTLTLKGRNADDEDYEDLAEVEIDDAGLYVADVTEFRSRLNYGVSDPGTGATFSAAVVATSIRYVPDEGTPVDD